MVSLQTGFPITQFCGFQTIRNGRMLHQVGLRELAMSNDLREKKLPVDFAHHNV